MRKSVLGIVVCGMCATLLAPAVLSGQVIVRGAGGEQEGGAPPVVQQRAVVVEAQDDGSGNIQIHSFSSDGGDFMLAAPLPISGAWGGGLSADPSQLIFDPQVRKNLELDDDQVKQLRQIQKDFAKQMQEKVNFDFGPNADRSKYKEMSKILQAISKERKEAMGAVLLPHQNKRLRQISTQMKMKNQGEAKALVSDDIAEELDISEKQKKRLKERAAEIKADMDKQIAKIKEEGRRKLLRELSSEQRSKLDEMMGETFEYKKRNWRDQIRRVRERSSDDENEDDEDR